MVRIKESSYSEGDKCNNCDNGVMQFKNILECRCHLAAPCNACVNAPLTCTVCGYYEVTIDE